MSQIFHAPITECLLLEADGQVAVNALFSEGARAAHQRPICLRTDFYVADSEEPLLVRDGSWSLYLDGEPVRLAYPEMPPALAQSFAHTLAVLNEDQYLQSSVVCFPLPWKDRVFKAAVNTQHISLLLFPDGFGAIVQEYIPSWLGYATERDYFNPALPASVRSELMSVFIPPQASEHDRLKALSRLASLHADFQFVLSKHADDIKITLAPFDLSDRF